MRYALIALLLLSTPASAIEDWERNTFSYGYATGHGGSPSALRGASQRALEDAEADAARKAEDQQRIYEDLANQRSRW